MATLVIELTQIAEQLRALSNDGQYYTDDPYQSERFHSLQNHRHNVPFLSNSA